jgi:hypothetical protein
MRGQKTCDDRSRRRGTDRPIRRLIHLLFLFNVSPEAWLIASQMILWVLAFPATALVIDQFRIIHSIREPL